MKLVEQITRLLPVEVNSVVAQVISRKGIRRGWKCGFADEMTVETGI